jgi:hypothetical protein
LAGNPRLVSATATTVGTVRRTNIGGPRGLRPGAHAFPGVTDDQPAAWCWVYSSTPSPPKKAEYTVYVVVNGKSPFRYFGVGMDTVPPSPPSGPPNIS